MPWECLQGLEHSPQDGTGICALVKTDLLRVKLLVSHRVPVPKFAGLHWDRTPLARCMQLPRAPARLCAQGPKGRAVGLALRPYTTNLFDAAAARACLLLRAGCPRRSCSTRCGLRCPRVREPRRRVPQLSIGKFLRSRHPAATRWGCGVSVHPCVHGWLGANASVHACVCRCVLPGGGMLECCCVDARVWEFSAL